MVHAGEVEEVATPTEVVEFFLVFDDFGKVGAVGKGVPFGEDAFVDCGDVVVRDEGFAQRFGVSFRGGYGGIGIQAEGGDEGIGKCRVVAGDDAEGIARDVFESGAFEAEFGMDGFFGAAGCGEGPDSQYGGREGVFLPYGSAVMSNVDDVMMGLGVGRDGFTSGWRRSSM